MLKHPWPGFGAPDVELRSHSATSIRWVSSARARPNAVHKHRRHHGRFELCCLMIVYVDDFLVTCAQNYDKKELGDLFEWGSQKELSLSDPLDFKGKGFTLQKKGKDLVLKVTQSKFLKNTPSPNTKILRGRQEEPLTAQVAAWVGLANRGSENTTKELSLLYEALNYALDTPDQGLTFGNVAIVPTAHGQTPSTAPQCTETVTADNVMAITQISPSVQEHTCRRGMLMR
ncbi:unnamed protein product [Effrenium voratum]|uniref:Uncharacterized protein n=1 Tax=Effrenium voratum TaxID=2562239 RepID=A0AA36J1V6_9DINO|nr:unnamed protein product [Effrenium voratum]